MSLRVRLLAALVAISAITLAAVALTLLPPLQGRLRTQSREALASTVFATRLPLQAALRADSNPADGGRIGTRSAELLSLLAQRSGARVALFPSPLDVRSPATWDSGSTPIATDDLFKAWVRGRSVESTADGALRIAVPIPATGPDRAPDWVLAVRQPEAQASQAVAVVRRAFAAAAVISFALALALGIVLSGTLVRRLVRLRGSALRMARDGLSAPPPPDDTTGDEVGDLARALRTMHTALHRQEEARRAFVATASHELRTPLTSIQGNLELLAEDLDEDALDASDARLQVSGAQEQLRRLANLATELLDLSRLDAGVELRSEPVDLAEIARAVTAEFAQRAIDAGALIEVPEPRGSVWAEGDPGAVARIVRILIDNGLRFSPRGGLLQITAEYAGDSALLTVSDDGPGVPGDEHERIFERFQRGSATGGEGGFGLGLAIGRELARRMDGELELVPEGLSRGATFVLELPIRLPQ